jgi:hypothetical protein
MVCDLEIPGPAYMSSGKPRRGRKNVALLLDIISPNVEAYSSQSMYKQREAQAIRSQDRESLCSRLFRAKNILAPSEPPGNGRKGWKQATIAAFRVLSSSSISIIPSFNAA